jgi:queuine/archaeosine tRNA-ribosyltransferase
MSAIEDIITDLDECLKKLDQFHEDSAAKNVESLRYFLERATMHAKSIEFLSPFARLFPVMEGQLKERVKNKRERDLYAMAYIIWAVGQSSVSMSLTEAKTAAQDRANVNFGTAQALFRKLVSERILKPHYYVEIPKTRYSLTDLGSDVLGGFSSRI